MNEEGKINNEFFLENKINKDMKAKFKYKINQYNIYIILK